MSDTVTNEQAAITMEFHEQCMAHLYSIIDFSGDRGVSDIHVVPEKPVMMLTQGELEKADGLVISQLEILEWLRQPGNLGPADDRALTDLGHVSNAYDSGKFRVRAAFRRTTSGVSVTLRLIPRSLPDADALGLPKQVQELIRRKAGLIIFEGPTGSGKTTAIASLIHKINKEMNEHVYLIEDPIEFVHEPIGNSVFTQREVGVHAKDFPTAVENALRSKPNVIVIGELLNPATAKAALHAATTGHLVMTTAHAGSVTEALDSFIGQFTAAEQPQIRSRLSQSLLAVVVQKLVPSLAGGLVPAREVLINNRNFAELIGDDGGSKLIHSQMEGDEHCFSLEDSLLDLVVTEKISTQVALDEARKPDTIRDGFARFGVRE